MSNVCCEPLPHAVQYKSASDSCLNANPASVVYLVVCGTGRQRFAKLGRSADLKRRLSNLQTGCPHNITDAFVICSDYDLEVQGLEKVLKCLLHPYQIHGEWYKVSNKFIKRLEIALLRINQGNLIAYEEIQDFDGSDEELEILMHWHAFSFARVNLPIHSSGRMTMSAVNVHEIAQSITNNMK